MARRNQRAVSRRVLCQGLAAMSVLPACGGPVDEALPLSGETETPALSPEAGPPETVLPPEPFLPGTVPASPLFVLGLACGDPTADGMVLATHHTEGRRLKAWVWPAEEASPKGPVFEREVVVGEGGLASVEVSGLKPHTLYQCTWVEWEDGKAIGRSEVGSFRTAPATEEAPVLRFAAVACTNNLFAKTSLERAAEQGPFDAFLLLGDTTYNDGAQTLEEFRARWRESLSSAGWKAMRAQAPILATWDDHEFTNNFNPETIDPLKLATAKQAFFEFTPTRSKGAGPLWKKVSFGKTADVFVLDCRSERKPSSRNSKEPIYISKEQMQWLKRELSASEARFKLLMNSVPISDLPFAFDLALGDRWEGYPGQRTEILDFIDRQGISGVLWVSGDFHLACVGRVARQGVGSTQTEVLVGPGAQVGNPLFWQFQKPQFDWVSNESNTTVLELNPRTGVVTCVWLGKDRVLHQQEIAL